MFDRAACLAIRMAASPRVDTAALITLKTCGLWRIRTIGFAPARDRFAPDSPLEEAGFEPSVPVKVLTVSEPVLPPRA
jgi:hypothetical protein